MRTDTATVDFLRAFKLPGMDRAFPPGRYIVETDQEQIDRASGISWRRLETRIHLHSPGTIEVLTIDPDALARALAADAEAGVEPANENDAVA